MAKRKRTVLCIEDKLCICTRASKGEKPASLAREFGVGKSTITDILKSSEKLTSFKDALVTDDAAKKRKTMKPATVHVVCTETVPRFSGERCNDNRKGFGIQ